MSFRTGLHVIAVIGLTAIAVALVGLWMEERREVKNSIHENYQEQSAEYSRNAAHNVAQKCNVGTFIAIRKCVRDEYDAYYANSSTNQDVKAQQDMALWAEAVFWATLITAGVGVAAIGFLWKDIKVGREVGRDQSRAFVHADAAELTWGGDRANDPKITLTIVNSGQTPARWVSITSKLKFIPINADILEFKQMDVCEIDFSQSKTSKFSALGGGMNLLLPGLTGTDYAKLKEAYIPRNSRFGGHKPALNCGIQLFGVIEYETIFGEEYHSEFCFGEILPRHYLDKTVREEENEKFRTTGTDITKAIGVNMKDVFKEEIPIKLPRTTAKAETYKKR